MGICKMVVDGIVPRPKAEIAEEHKHVGWLAIDHYRMGWSSRFFAGKVRELSAKALAAEGIHLPVRHGLIREGQLYERVKTLL